MTQPVPPSDNGQLTPDLVAALQQREKPCAHCGGWHARACPRVRRMVWHPNGGIAEVEFWPDGRWSDEFVIWPETLAETEPET